MILVEWGTPRTLHPPPAEFNAKIAARKFAISFAGIRYPARVNEQAPVD
jgi:hypothetical protein